jgi:bifunctional DNase/RNase
MKCGTPDCKEKATFHLSWVENRACSNEQHLCEPHARARLGSSGLPIEPMSRFTGPRGKVDHASQFEIALIVISEINDQQLLYLSEVDGMRLVPFTLGIFEATALDRKIKGYRTPRPLTHDAFADSIRLLGGELQHVLVHRLENQCYYAEGLIRANGRLLQLDMRPSDAFALALIMGCPIFFAEQVLKQVAQTSKAR